MLKRKSDASTSFGSMRCSIQYRNNYSMISPNWRLLFARPHRADFDGRRGAGNGSDPRSERLWRKRSRDVSSAPYAINQPDLFIIPDATQDERFAKNPLVISDPKIRFYAGAPLITPDGYGLGTLCVIDKVPRELRPDQKQALRILARHAVLQLELRRRTQDVRSGRAAMAEAAPATTLEQNAQLKTGPAKARRDLRQPSKKKTKPQPSKKPSRPVSRRKPARNKR